MLDLIYKTFDARMDKYDVHKAGSQTQIQIPAVYEYEVEARIQIQKQAREKYKDRAQIHVIVKQICSKEMPFYFP